MKFYDLDSLVRDSKQNNLYNLAEPTFRKDTTILLQKHIVTPEQTMRLDLVCFELYNRTDYVDFLLSLNDIDNPLNIMEGDEILYAAETAIPDYRLSLAQTNDVRAQLLNVNKTTRKDDSRKKYVEENFSLPPTFNERPQDPIKIENNQLVIGR
jgi:hypothetical protein